MPNKVEALVDRLLAGHSPIIREAFLEAVRDARDSVRIADVTAALERGDIEAAAQLLDFPRAFFAQLDQTVAAAYLAGGREHNALIMAALRRRGLTMEIRFDPGASRAAEWTRAHAANLVTEIVAEQRVTIRQAIAAGLDAGRNPRTVALDVVGRMDRVAKRRVGGVVGLTSQQAQYVANARAELGDPKLMAGYFERVRRDRRMDGIVIRALRGGRPVPAADVARITARYADRLLAYRGETIGRTETLTASSYSQDEAARQAMEAAGIRSGQVRRKWRARLDGRTRESHATLNGHTVGLDETFTSPATGARMRFPRDTSLGAGGEDTIRCRCYSTMSFDWSA